MKTLSVCRKLLKDNMVNRIILLLTLALTSTINAVAQQDSTMVFAEADSAAVEVGDTTSGNFIHNLWSHDPHSVGRAALYSAVLPGLGQAYNGKYWKIPIVYGALGTSGYFIYYWYDFFDELRTAYIARTDEDPLTIDNQYDYIPSDETLLQYVTASKRYLDVMVIVTFAVYSLNIVDAIVDAHLYDFNVSDDLSMQISPAFMPRVAYGTAFSGTAGLQIQLRFK